MLKIPFKLICAIAGTYAPIALSADVGSAIGSTVDWRVVMFEKNPGLMTALVTALILPITMLLLQNRQTRKLKELEASIDLDKSRQAKEFDLAIDAKKGRESHEGTVYSALVAILFEVQKLHIRLSSACVDYNCLNDASKSFQVAFEAHQAKISENQLYLSSKLVGHIYSFYQKYGMLMTDLTHIQDQQNFVLALPCVYVHSQSLAEEIIQVQEAIVAERADLKAQFDRIESEKMKYCCGRVPPPELVEQYEMLRVKVGGDAPIVASSGKV
jgi:hypothetical protein